MANRNVRQISVFLDGKQVEGSIKNIAGAFREATNQLAKMVVGSEEYIAQLEEVRKYNDALNEHRQRIRGIGEDTEVVAGSMNALQQEVGLATKTLNNLVIGSAEYDEQLRKVQQLEAQLTEARKAQQAQNIATAGSVNAMEQEYRQATEQLNMLVVGSDEYNQQLKEVQRLEAQLTETRKKQQVQNTATAGSIRALEEELQRERNILRDLVIGTKEYQEQLKKVQQLDDNLTKHQQSLKGVGQGWSFAKAGLNNFVGIAAGALAVDSLIGYGKQLFGVGVQMDALEKKAKTVFGATLPEVTAEAEKNAAAMGLTTSQYINAAAAIQDILIPMGFQRTEAADISTQLTNLSGALSEWTGGQVSATQVSDILSSALTGEREQLKQLGIVLQQSDIDARLAEKGLGKLTGTMRQQAEAAATLELILEKSTDAQAGFAAGSDSAIRRQAQLTARIQETVEKLSTLLLPAFEAISTAVSGVVDAIAAVVEGIESMVDPAKAATEAFDEQANKVEDLESNILPLLDRYDELATKANLNQAEQDELQKIITTVAGVVPTAVTEFDKYGKAIGINTDKVREFIEVEKARLKFVNEAAIRENEALKQRLEGEAQVFQQRLNSRKISEVSTSGGGPLGGGTTVTERNLTNEELIQLQNEAAALQEKLKGVNAEVARLKGETIEAPVITPPEDDGGEGGGGSDAKTQAEKLAKDLQNLIERTTEIRRELITKSQEDELTSAVAAVEKRYDAEIAKAIELEKLGVTEATAQRIALEQLRQEEITLVTRQIAEKAREETEKQIAEDAKLELEARAKADQEAYEFLQQRQQEREEAQKEIDQFKQEAKTEETGSKMEQELAELEAQYQQLLLLAEDYFNSDLDLQLAYEAKKKAITDQYAQEALEKKKEYDENLLKAEQDLQSARLDMLQQGAALLSGFFDETSALGKALFLFEKAAAAASVIINLQKEKAAIFAATRLGTIFDPTGALGAALAAPQIAAANVRAGISIATIAATAIKGIVKQKAEGGYLLPVSGEDDRRTYTAAVIPPPDTGMLPHHPVLFQSQATGAPVLASERGAEYFVSSESLRNPYVANLTRMIDNITLSGGRGVPQFAEGGTNTATAIAAIPPAAPGVNMATIEQLNAAINTLNALLASGIVAVIPDRTLTGIPERLGKINNASGGFFG